MNKQLTYISLFSGAGIGCYGFQKAGFKCIATNEKLLKRLKIQKYNKKCKFETGYILGDITDNEVKIKILNEIKYWKKNENLKDVDVIIATPPCQGMSVINQKKNNELSRNSLVIKAIELIKEINPKIFILENVKSFLKTECVNSNNKKFLISEEIKNKLIKNYVYSHKIINFKNYGSNSSRTRIIVIGIRKDLSQNIAPFELFPNFSKEKNLKEIIGNFKPLLKMNEFDDENPLHHFKKYDKKMYFWIKDLKEGESAMDNINPKKKPQRIINGKIEFYKKGFGDKYKKQFWNKVGACVHTANDCLASQNTIHPVDNRVFSIKELMKMMSIPFDFKWDYIDLKQIDKNKVLNWLLKNERNIRKCIGEAVPTGVFLNIANNIKKKMNNNEDFYLLSKNFEKNNNLKEKNAAFYTTRINLSYIYDLLPDFKKDNIKILEPSVGFGNFLIPLIKKYDSYKKIELTVIDIDKMAIENLKKEIKKILPKNFSIKFINNDFLNEKIINKFDLVIGNPPFLKLSKEKSKKTNCKNIFELFIKKSLKISQKVIMIFPKLIISSQVYKNFRIFLKNQNISNIIDFNGLGFKNVKIETIAIYINNIKKNKNILINFVPKNLILKQNKKYIFDNKLPHWIIYRNSKFDEIYNKMTKDIFYIYKNYEFSNKNYCKKEEKNIIWVVKSKNISFHEPKLEHKRNYDKYIKKDLAKKTKFYKYISEFYKDLFLIPTLTYYPRIIKMKKNILVNGSVLVAKLKDNNIELNQNDINFFYSENFRNFYSIACNYARRTLNINKQTIKFFGIIRQQNEQKKI